MRLARLSSPNETADSAQVRSNVPPPLHHAAHSLFAPPEQYLALQYAREREGRAARSPAYSLRDGIEGTISQGVRAFGLRRSRYIGGVHTHLQMVALSPPMNSVRFVAWLNGDELAKKRGSALAQLFY